MYKYICIYICVCILYVYIHSCLPAYKLLAWLVDCGCGRWACGCATPRPLEIYALQGLGMGLTLFGVVHGEWCAGRSMDTRHTPKHDYAPPLSHTISINPTRQIFLDHNHPHRSQHTRRVVRPAGGAFWALHGCAGGAGLGRAARRVAAQGTWLGCDLFSTYQIYIYV